ncbi:MAG: 1-deoxy-D-xylulose-5-phosphate synthase, partial [Pseudomonadota bacterium]
ALRRLPESKLELLAAELREFLLGSVSRNGGHLSSGLGVVELTIALHYVFDTPRDLLVWDVGHQGYPHKALTGRRERMHTMRKKGGLSGFLRRDESPYDAFGAGHSSTSISAAVGMAVASERTGKPCKTVAVIGDGALTAGLAFEALQQAGAMPDLDLIVIVNDNGMSISPNVGALSESLQGTADAREPMADRDAGRLFRELGLGYFGPCDGHDVGALVRTLREVRDAPGPRVLHVRTQKGHGYEPAEADPIKYHGVTKFDPAVGIQPAAAKPALPTYTEVFGEWLCEAASGESRLVAITPAMREGSGLVRYADRYPDRYFDVGIAEQHSISFAAGLACRGARPVVAIYSSFLQRAYDQLVHDVALQNLPVLFAIDRAGLVGPDGATHNGALDLSFLRCVPGMVVMAPSDGNELRDMLHTGLAHPGPAAVRYPRCAIPAPLSGRAPQELPLGTADLRRIGAGRTALLAFGTLLGTALELAEELDATVVNMRFVKPLDERMVVEIARHHELVVTLEENALTGGAGCAVNECLAARHLRPSVLNLGLPDRFIEHGTRDEALRDAGLDRDTMRAAIMAREAQLARSSERAEDKRAARAGARARAAIAGPFFSG